MPHAIRPEEIVQAALRSMVEEARTLIEGGVAACESDVDIVLVTGYGFPREKGGPIWFSNQQ